MASATRTTDAAKTRSASSILIHEPCARDEPGDVRGEISLHPVEPGAVASVGGLCFETVPGGAHDELLMATPEGADVRVNGLLVPRLCTLRDGDIVRACDGSLLHATHYEACEPMVPAGALLDRTCVTCRAPLTGDTRVRVCSCGEPRHDEGDDVPADERRDCWLLGACPSCGATPRSEPGFTWWPEGIARPSEEA